MGPLCEGSAYYFEGGFPLFAETTRSELASTRLLAEQVLASSQNNFLSSHLNEHMPNRSFRDS